MNTTDLYWDGAGYYAGELIGNTCRVWLVAPIAVGSHEASEIARRKGLGTISEIPNLETAFKYGDYVKVNGNWIKSA